MGVAPIVIHHGKAKALRYMLALHVYYFADSDTV